jgi:putative SOS response-associated peptidase YedK
MCGRFLNRTPASETAHIFGTKNALPNYPARYNIAPTQGVLTVRFNPETRERSLDILRWGLVPHWAKDLSFGSRCINARAETIASTPAFRDAFKSRRCIIPASGFYEWKKTGGAKQPFAIVPKDEALFAFAGLWENWRDRSAGEGAEWI